MADPTPTALGEQRTAAEPPADPYRWLEDHGSPRTRSWLAHQQTLLERHTSHRPGATAAWERLLAEIETASAGRELSPRAEAGGMLFRHELTASGGQALVVSGTDVPDRTLLDTGALGSVSRLAGWQPDPTGRVVVAQLHRDGHENGGLTLIPTCGGRAPRELADAAPHSATAFLGRLLCYSAGTRTEHTLRAHHLDDGTTATVHLPLSGPVRLSLHAGPAGHLLLRSRTPGSPSVRWWCTRWTGRGTPDWQPLPLDELRVTAVGLGTDRLYLAGPGRSLAALDLTRTARGDSAAAVPLASPPEPDGTRGGEIRSLRVLGPGTDPRLVVVIQSGTLRRLQVRRPVAATAASAAGPAPDGVTWHTRLRLGPTGCGRDGTPGDSLWLLADDPRFGALSQRVTAAAPAAPPVRRAALRTLTTTGRDGTTLPVTICDPPANGIRRHRPVPTLVTVYGGFGVPLEPSWDPVFAAWLAAGGRIAWVHARGGGEFGPDWAAAGRGAGKSDTVDDLCAAAGALEAAGEAGPGQLAALAASNGGLVLSAALVRAPRLFTAVVCAAPLTDMARYLEGGLGRLWREEYGDPADPGALRSLLSYSPYHRVRTGDPYPAALFITGGNDARVRPWHAWKLCAALQAATSSAAPVLLDHQDDTGHYGRAGDDARSLNTRVLTLLAGRTGLRAPSAAPKPVPVSPTRSIP